MQVRVLAAFKFSFENIISANVNPTNMIGKSSFFIFKIIKLFLNKMITNTSLLNKSIKIPLLEILLISNDQRRFLCLLTRLKLLV